MARLCDEQNERQPATVRVELTVEAVESSRPEPSSAAQPR